jgi:hypothetical protein
VTGSGDSKRELYTTDSEYTFKVKRPVIVNGINVPSEKADLLSRFVAVEVLPISADERLSESQFWAEFEADRKPVAWRPRMSDWGELASALYDYLGWGRERVMLDNQQVKIKQHDAALDSITGTALVEYLTAEFDSGKTEMLIVKTDLWQDVKAHVPLDSRRYFPQSARNFSGELNRLKPALAHKGFEIDDGHVGRGNAKQRAFRITYVGGEGPVDPERGRWGRSGDDENNIFVPIDIAIDKPKNPRSEQVGTMGTIKNHFYKDTYKKKGDVKEKV